MFLELSKAKIKLLNSLKIKKFRDMHQLFTAEGDKLVFDLLNSSFEVIELFADEKWLEIHQKKIPQSVKLFALKPEQIKKISKLKTPTSVIALLKKPTYNIDYQLVNKKLSLFLDAIQDPGNLGTIIRTADWFGIETIFCTLNSVDVFNPKVVQATMGAISRVKLHYVNSRSFFTEIRKLKNYPVFGTFLEGENIYNQPLSSSGLLIMGNEGKGVSDEISQFVTQKLHIPTFPQGKQSSESLNIASATAIICSEFVRRT